jgi:hypothetical protein
MRDGVSWMTHAMGKRRDKGKGQSGIAGALLQFFIIPLFWLGPEVEVQAQWTPPAELRNVPVRDDCRMTHRGVGVSVQPTIFYPHGAIFLCPDRLRAIDGAHPGAARFFLVHEYGHLALKTREEAAADEWAARQLGMVPAERNVVRAVLLHFIDEGERFDPMYGSGLDRALRIARAARIPEKEWPGALIDYAKLKAQATGTSFILRVASGYCNAAQMTVFVDRLPVGFLSNLDDPIPLRSPPVAEGVHTVQLADVWLYHLEPDRSKTEIARHLAAEARFASSGKKRVLLELKYENGGLELRAEEE